MFRLIKQISTLKQSVRKDFFILPRKKLPENVLKQEVEDSALIRFPMNLYEDPNEYFSKIYLEDKKHYQNKWKTKSLSNRLPNFLKKLLRNAISLHFPSNSYLAATYSERLFYFCRNSIQEGLILCTAQESEEKIKAFFKSLEIPISKKTNQAETIFLLTNFLLSFRLSIIEDNISSFLLLPSHRPFLKEVIQRFYPISSSILDKTPPSKLKKKYFVFNRDFFCDKRILDAISFHDLFSIKNIDLSLLLVNIFELYGFKEHINEHLFKKFSIEYRKTFSQDLKEKVYKSFCKELSYSLLLDSRLHDTMSMHKISTLLTIFQKEIKQEDLLNFLALAIAKDNHQFDYFLFLFCEFFPDFLSLSTDEKLKLILSKIQELGLSSSILPELKNNYIVRNNKHHLFLIEGKEHNSLNVPFPKKRYISPLLFLNNNDFPSTNHFSVTYSTWRYLDFLRKLDFLSDKETISLIQQAQKNQKRLIPETFSMNSIVEYSDIEDIIPQYLDTPYQKPSSLMEEKELVLPILDIFNLENQPNVIQTIDDLAIQINKLHKFVTTLANSIVRSPHYQNFYAIEFK